MAGPTPGFGFTVSEYGTEGSGFGTWPTEQTLDISGIEFSGVEPVMFAFLRVSANGNVTVDDGETWSAVHQVTETDFDQTVGQILYRPVNTVVEPNLIKFTTDAGFMYTAHIVTVNLEDQASRWTGVQYADAVLSGSVGDNPRTLSFGDGVPSSTFPGDTGAVMHMGFWHSIDGGSADSYTSFFENVTVTGGDSSFGTDAYEYSHDSGGGVYGSPLYNFEIYGRWDTGWDATIAGPTHSRRARGYNVDDNFDPMPPPYEDTGEVRAGGVSVTLTFSGAVTTEEPGSVSLVPRGRTVSITELPYQVKSSQLG